MRNILNGIETLTVTRKPYNPMPNMFLEFLPTLWINTCTFETFIVVGREGCVTNIQPIKDFDGIEEILTQCGIVKPNENKQVDVEGSCGLRAVSDDCADFCINLLTGYGLKGGGQICKGETRTIQLDAEITGDVKGPDIAKVGDVPVFKDETGKSITTSNINSVDGLTKITKSSKGEQKLLVETVDTEAGSDAGVEAKSTGNGTPYFQLTQGENKWRRIINPETGALEIRPVDDLSKDSILTFLPNGVIRSPYQPTAAAYLLQTPSFPKDREYEIGGNRAFVKILDTDGYNQNANNLFVGDGNGNGLTYTSQYDNAKYFVGFQFLVDTLNQDQRVLYNIRLYYGVKSINYAFSIVQPDTYRSQAGFLILPLNKGEKFRFTIKCNNSSSIISNNDDVPNYYNYVGISMLG